MAGYKYFAFISYQHANMRQAVKLQRMIEHYQIPAIMRKNNEGLPKRFKVFRDQDELTTGILSDELQKKLDESKYLIVICSPESAKSPYVGLEIDHFLKTQRTANIIPFIISGTPNGDKNGQNDCFNPKLKSSSFELLGIDVQAQKGATQSIKFKRAFIKLVAKFIGVDFDALWNRYQRYQRKRRTITAVTAIALVVLAIVAWGAQPFDMKMRIDTQRPDLPLSVLGTDSLSLTLPNNEVRSMSIRDFDNDIILHDIPGKLQKKQMRVQGNIYGMLPVDTIILFDKEATLIFNRNPMTYGNIK